VPTVGDSLIDDVLEVCLSGMPGVAERGLRLATLWAKKYGFGNVAIFNLDAPGISPQMDRKQVYCCCLSYLTVLAFTNDQYFRVDLDEFAIQSKNGRWSLRS
jgi:hypothetical protein